MSEIAHKFYIFSLKSVGRLVRWSPLLTLSPKSYGFKPQTGQKKLHKTPNFKVHISMSIRFIKLAQMTLKAKI
jgi:hypothetical protein